MNEFGEISHRRQEIGPCQRSTAFGCKPIIVQFPLYPAPHSHHGLPRGTSGIAGNIIDQVARLPVAPRTNFCSRFLPPNPFFHFLVAITTRNTTMPRAGKKVPASGAAAAEVRVLLRDLSPPSLYSLQFLPIDQGEGQEGHQEG